MTGKKVYSSDALGQIMRLKVSPAYLAYKTSIISQTSRLYKHVYVAIFHRQQQWFVQVVIILYTSE